MKFNRLIRGEKGSGIWWASFTGRKPVKVTKVRITGNGYAYSFTVHIDGEDCTFNCHNLSALRTTLERYAKGKLSASLSKTAQALQ